MKVAIIVLLIGVLPIALTAQNHVNYDNLDHYIEKAVKDFDLTGLTISIVKDGSVTFRKAYGLKDASKNEPMTVRSLFNIASCTKAFTAACLGMLVEEGKIAWQDKVIDYIPEFRLSEPYVTKELNMIDILSHRSGLATFDGDLLWYETDYSNEEIIRRMRHLPLRRDFRSQFGYQNNMFLIAGEIVHEVSDTTWSDFVYERIFNPLDMTDSRTCSEHLTEDQDIAYPHLDGKVRELYIEDPGPAGSIYSNAEEMSRWITMLLNGGTYQGQRLLNEDTVEQLFAPQTLLNLSSFMKDTGSHFYAYGLGWFLFDYSGRKVAEHGGGMPGYISKVTLVPEENLGFVILTNDMNRLPNALRYKILDTFLNEGDKDWAQYYLELKNRREQGEQKRMAERKAKRAKNTQPSLDLSQYTGTYNDQMYGDATVELKDGQLWLTLVPTKDIFVSAMQHWHYDTFRIKFRDEFLPEGFVTFRFDSNGEVTGLKIDLPNPDFHFNNLDFKKVERQ
ncbi:serine hydrolase [candidate division KSB1 bacterium]|nr:serine hydrolase [candidate division KSB1 bacterium]NIR69983.1 serine hydrolase [candidate division KSB1 bacterium]NIS25883.1 serine hydrolase [candidate division KSB1 bacterium]NIT72759.1 serine hydrolase [candidate division KSB1 bacterium]NIU26571.1 serine hydrolase [candidate division KSB1 bacterium]